MRPEYVLARLNAKGSDWTGIPGGFAKLLPSDVSLALAGLSRAPYLFGRAKYVEHQIAAELEQIAILGAIDLAIRDGWKTPKGKDCIRKITRLALSDAVLGHKCPICDGRKVIHKRGGLVEDCEKCSATGKGKRNIKEIKRLINLTGNKPFDIWYYSVLAMISHWDERVRSHVIRKMGA